MRSRWSISLGTVAVATTVLIVSLVSLSPASPALRIHVIEHATTDTVIDTDGSGDDSTGDLLTFNNEVFDETNSDVVATSHGDCIRVEVGVSWECRWVTIFEPVGDVRGGSIAVEGPFYDSEDSVLAVTGGTGIYKSAQGAMRLHARSGAEFDFVFKLTNV